MKKVIKFFAIVLLLIIFLFSINVNTYAIVVNEIGENSNNSVNTLESNEQENKEDNETTNNVVSDEEIEKTEDSTIQNQNEIENSIVEEENSDELNLEENKIEVQTRMSVAGTETIVEGTTNRITTKLSGRAVGIDGGREENGADVNLWDDVSVTQQRFKFVYYEEGYYKIINEKSGKLLNVEDSGLESEMPVNQWEDKGEEDSQKWIVQDTGYGYYNIISKLNGLYLTVDGNGANCDLLCVKSATGGDNQKFQIVEKGIPTGEKIVEEGTYKIVLATAPTQSLTVDGGKTNNGANVHIWEYVDSPQQQFRLVYDGNGYYEIVPVHSEKRVDVVGYGNEANVDQWEYNGGNDNQKWVIRKNKLGNYNIISKRDSLFLDAYQSKTANGTNIEVYEQSRGNGQEFKLEKIEKEEEEEIVYGKTVEEGTYKIVLATAPTQSLTVDGGKTNDGANVHIWEYVNSLQQQFNLRYDGNGYYEIIPLHSGKRIDVVGYGNEANVDQWEYNGGNDNQKWAIVKNKSGNYNIISKRQGLYLDAYQSKTVNGTNIQVYEKSGGIGQEFKLEKIEDKSERTIADGIYKIAPQANANIVVEVSASNTDNDGRIQIWQDFNATAQKFNVEYKDGFYKITTRHTGKSLTVKGGKIEEGTDIVQYDYQGLNSQKWVIHNDSKGEWRISPLSNPELSIIVEGSIENGSKLKLSKMGNKNEKFNMINITENERIIANKDYRVLVGKDENKALEVRGGSVENNAIAGIWDYGNADWQKFNFEYQEGFYKITAKHTGKSLTVKNNKLVEGTEIVQYDYQGLDSQKWIIRSDGKNGYVISLLSNPNLSISIKGDIINGSDMILSKTQNNENQIFLLRSQITIVLNPGHGGSETGCANGWIVEKNVTLEIAKKIQNNLRNYSDINVILTRTGDYTMDLPSRAMIARNNNADLYVSLHINDEASYTATGSQMYVPFYEGTKHYNSSMTRLANLIQDNLGKIGIRENLSGGIVKRNIDRLPKYQYLINGMVVQADYYADIRCAMKGDTLDYGEDLTNNTGVPAILVEHCFMNSSDSQFVDSDYDLQRLADADSDAIIEYFNL